MRAFGGCSGRVTSRYLDLDCLSRVHTVLLPSPYAGGRRKALPKPVCRNFTPLATTSPRNHRHESCLAVDSCTYFMSPCECSVLVSLRWYNDAFIHLDIYGSCALLRVVQNLVKCCFQLSTRYSGGFRLRSCGSALGLDRVLHPSQRFCESRCCAQDLRCFANLLGVCHLVTVRRVWRCRSSC